MLSVIARVLWAITAVIVLSLAALPISPTVQLEMSAGAIVALMLLWLFGRGRHSRYIFLAIASLVAWRYLYWRVFSTLPPASDWVNFSAALVLLSAELYCFYILFLNLFVTSDPLDRPARDFGNKPDLPAVDVFIPSYNEDILILATTLAAAKSMEYPKEKLTVWLLDDGGTDQKCADPDRNKSLEARTRRAALQKLCAELDVRYLTRKANLHAKAGNLNNGLKNSTGEIVVVFDADHVPFRSFLRETIGYFAEDPRMFLVQTPHAFINPDPVERNLRTFGRMPAENEMFYAVNQRGLDKWNASFFCGSAALLRRSALEQAGGFSGITITEDCETALDLHAHGWNSVYIDKTLIAGLQPDTLESFIGQRSRWCQGMLQIFILNNPLFKSGLTWIQKLCYLSNMTFWFFPFPRLVFIFAPLLYIFFGMKIVVANVEEAVAYTLTYVIVNLMLQNYLFGRVRWPFISELYEYIQGVYLIRATLAVVLAPRRPKFNVTAKNVTLDHDHLSSMSLPYFLIYGLLFITTCVATYRYYFEPSNASNNLLLVVGLWNLFNLLTAGAALGVVAERRQTERVPSLNVERHGVLRLNGMAMYVRVEQVSWEKCRIRTEALPPTRRADDTTEGMLFVLPGEGEGTAGELSAYPSLPVKLMQSELQGEEWVCELAFHQLQPRDFFALVDLMYADAEAMARFQGRRRGHKNLIGGSLQFIWWGLIGPLRAFSYLLSGAATKAPASKALVPARTRLLGAAPVLKEQAFGLTEVAGVPRPTEQRKAPDTVAAGETGSTPGWVGLMVEAENEAIAESQRRRSSDGVGPSEKMEELS